MAERRRLQFVQGPTANIPILDVGEPAFSTDTQILNIGNGTSVPAQVVMAAANQIVRNKIYGDYIAASTGSINSYIVTLPSPAFNLTSYFTGLRLTFMATFANTGPATLNINGIGASSLVSGGGGTLAADSIKPNMLVEVVYDGSKFRVFTSGLNNSSGGGGTFVPSISGGDTANRPPVTPNPPPQGTLYYNTDIDGLQVYDPTAGWMDIPVIYTANKTLTVGSTGADFPTVTAAFDYLRNKRIADGVTLTISVMPETFNVTSTIRLNHPDSQYIRLVGETPTSQAVTAFVSATGTSENWDVVLQVSSAAIYTVDDFVIIRGTSGTGAHQIINGCWRISAVNTGMNQITIAHTAFNSTFPTLTVNGGTVFCMKTKFNIAPGITGFLSTTGMQLINNIVVYDTTRGSGNGFDLAENRNSTTLDTGVGVFGFRFGVLCQGSVRVVCRAAVCGSSTHNVLVRNQSSLTATTDFISAGSRVNALFFTEASSGFVLNSIITSSQTGLRLENMSSGLFTGASLIANETGAVLLNNSQATLNAATVNVNSVVGVVINNTSTAIINNATFSGNVVDVTANNMSFANVADSTGVTNTSPVIGVSGTNQNSFISNTV